MDNLQNLAILPELEAFQVVTGENGLRVKESHRNFLFRGSATQVQHGIVSCALEVELAVMNAFVDFQILGNDVWIALQIPFHNEDSATAALQTLRLAAFVPDLMFGRLGYDRVFLLSLLLPENEHFRELFQVTMPITPQTLFVPTSQPDIRLSNRGKFLGCSRLEGNNRVYTYNLSLDRKSSVSTYLPCLRGRYIEENNIVDEPNVLICERSAINDAKIANIFTEITYLRFLGAHSPYFIPLLDFYRDNEFTYTIFPKYILAAADIAKPLAAGQCRALMMQVAHAILAAHNQQIVIRNLCLQNILLIPSSPPPGAQYVISNLSCAQHLLNQTNCLLPFFHPQNILGEGPYRPPEFWALPTQNLGFYDPKKVDIWCLGVVLLTLLTGKNPFNFASMLDERFRVLVSVNGINGLIMILMGEVVFSPVLLDLLRGMLMINPAERFTIEQVNSHPWITAAAERYK